MIGDFFNSFLIDPLTNLFVFLTAISGNAGFGVILLTVLIKVVTLPLQIRQMHTQRMMASIMPRQQEITKRYKDPRRRQEEMMKVYREAGVNPIGCFGPILLQMPIFIALFAMFRHALGEAPEALIETSERLYSWSYLRASLPLRPEFLWMHMGRPDPLILPILVAATTYILQKMMQLPAVDERARAQAGMMNLLMPLIFGWITITLPSGLGLYYVLSNVASGVMQYGYVGGGPFNWRGLVGLSQDPVLPRAYEQRQRRMEEAKKLGRGGDEPEAEAEEAPPAKPKGKPPAGNGAGRRRRRYASGKRRGRR